MPRRRRITAALLPIVAVAALAPGWWASGAAAQGGGGAPPPGTASARRTGDLWFDPTQLPSFTGTVERYLLNPRGETDALLFREGPQVVFPPDVAEAVRQAAAPGRPITVWGIRARGAPVITMLAFAPNAETTPTVVERFYWRLSGRQPQERPERLAVSGTVKQPYYAPQGEIAGAVLDDGTVVLLPQGTADGVRELLRPGAKLAAEGGGTAVEGGGRALLADRIGDGPAALRPLAAPVGPSAGSGPATGVPAAPAPATGGPAAPDPASPAPRR